MISHRHLSISALTAVLTALPLLGTGAPLAAQEATAPVLAIAAVPPAASARAHAQRERANLLTLGGDWAAAGREWARTARSQRAQGELPVEAMRMQAEMYHVQGFRADAAAVLVQLGQEAEAAGRMGVSAQAFLEATVLYQQAKLHDDALVARRHLDRALASSEVEPEVRRALQRRIPRG